MITDSELIFWIVSGVLGLIAFGVLWHIAKKYGDEYVEVRDEWK